MAEQTSKADRVKLNRELAQMLKGSVIMDVTTPEQARIAEEAGACAVMALERIPADIRAAGGISRMSDPKMIKGIQEAVSIPVMAKCRIGHIVEAQVLQAIEIDYIDESALEDADAKGSINKLEVFLNANDIVADLKPLRDLQTLRSAGAAHGKGSKYDRLYGDVVTEDHREDAKRLIARLTTMLNELTETLKSVDCRDEYF